MNPEDYLLNNPVFLGMDPEKLQFILSFVQKKKPASMKDAMPFLLANMNAARKQNLKFSPAEVQLIAEILSRDLPPQEKERVTKMISLMMKNTSSDT